jgi:hypothetical protein
MFGFPPELEARVRAFWLEHIHPDDRAGVVEASHDVFEGRVDHIRLDYRYLHPTRGLVWYRHTSRSFERDRSGRVSRTAGAIQDITDQKRTEEDLRTLSRRLIQAQEAGRALLARELHDDVTQRMAVLAIDLGRAESEAPGSARSEIMRTVREGLVRLSEDIHTLAYHLHPAVLEELGLAEALRTECERRGRHVDIAVTLDLDPVPAAVGKDATLCLYRVAQEALNNVARHARAGAAADSRSAGKSWTAATHASLSLTPGGDSYSAGPPARIRSCREHRRWRWTWATKARRTRKKTRSSRPRRTNKRIRGRWRSSQSGPRDCPSARRERHNGPARTGPERGAHRRRAVAVRRRVSDGRSPKQSR